MPPERGLSGGPRPESSRLSENRLEGSRALPIRSGRKPDRTCGKGAFVLRLRLSIEEDGLVALVDQPWRPAITENRLPIILSLAADCGLIWRDGDEGYVLAQGTK